MSSVGISCREASVAIARWLIAVAVLVFVMIVVGGITRLTESGLSITEWQLITGALPPLSDAAWAEAFAKYRQIPEYIEINGPAGMTLADFKKIYFWEWLHRLIGRLIGIAFALPLAWFWLRGAIPAGYKGRLLALLALGGMQGALGWYMVQSGLSARTDVSHFRLSVHLLAAFLILGGLLWTALDLRRLVHRDDGGPAQLTGFAAFIIAIVAVQLLYGAWVAGLDARYVSSRWPAMTGGLFPAGIDWSRGVVRAMTGDPYLVHFIHRWWAWITVVALVWMAREVRIAGDRPAAIAIHCAFGTQILLGIATVLTGMNIVFAILHQAVAALLVVTLAWGAHVLGRRGSARAAP